MKKERGQAALFSVLRRYTRRQVITTIEYTCFCAISISWLHSIVLFSLFFAKKRKKEDCPMDSPLFYQKWPLRPEPPPPDSLWESFFSFLRRVSVVWV